MGLYRRAKGMWWLAVTVAGRQHHESCHTHNKRLAEKILSIRLAEIAEGRFRLPASNPPLLEDWARGFLETIIHPNTKRRYTSSVENLRAFFGKTRLSNITGDRIEKFKSERRLAGVGPATVNRDLAVLRRMLKLAARQRLVAQSPFDANGVEFLDERSQRRQPHILTFEEQARLLAVAPPRLRVLIVLLTETGLRVNKEALQLEWADIDFANGVIHVRQSKTPAGRRIVPLSELCKAELLRWKNLCGPQFSAYVFPRFSNTRHPLQGGRKGWINALKKAGIPYFPIYNLRHTFASRLTAAGASPITVAQMLGHSSTGIVETYAKAIDEFRREAIRKLENYRESAGKQSAVAPPVGMIQ
jgi:integrase